MTDDKKTLKFQMMMSPAEANELDDWMFKNRIRSRAEAIRRLCQIGLIVDQEADTLAPAIAELIQTVPTMLTNDLIKFGEDYKSGARMADALQNFIEASKNTSIELIGELTFLLFSLNSILEPIQAYRSNDDFEEAKKKAESLQNSIKSKMEEIMKIADEFDIPSEEQTSETPPEKI